MQIIETVDFLENVIKFLEEEGKSDDITALLFTLTVPVGPLNDLVTELALAASSAEEEGVGCKSLAEIRQMFDEFKNQ